MTLRLIIKRSLFLIGILIALPFIILTRLEEFLTRKRAGIIFGWSKEILSLCPTILGEVIRLGYYWGVCKNISPDVLFMFGSMLSRQDTVIGPRTVIGAYSMIGYARIGEGVLMGARVSLLSGKYMHGHPGERAENGTADGRFEIISIGDNSWIGQDSTLLASIGANCTVGAGSVVFKEVPDNSTVMGNPARKVNIDTAANPAQ